GAEVYVYSSRKAEQTWWERPRGRGRRARGGARVGACGIEAAERQAGLAGGEDLPGRWERREGWPDARSGRRVVCWREVTSTRARPGRSLRSAAYTRHHGYR